MEGDLGSGGKCCDDFLKWLRRISAGSGVLRSPAWSFPPGEGCGGEREEEYTRRQEETGSDGVRTPAAPQDSAAQTWPLPGAQHRRGLPTMVLVGRDQFVGTW